jgi:hypothetical protein
MRAQFSMSADNRKIEQFVAAHNKSKASFN